MKNIIAALALDGGDDGVVARAMQLAARHDAALTLVHAMEDTDFGDVEALGGMDAETVRAVVGRNAADRLAALAGRAGVDARQARIVAEGKASDVIMDFAGERRADLVIIGPGKRRNLREKAFGSTADRVVRAADVPVLIVRREGAAPYGRAIVAADLSPQSLSASRAARTLAPDAIIEHVHVVEMPLSFEQTLLQAGASKVEISRYRQARLATARDRLKAVFADADGKAPMKLRLVQGDARAVLVRQARRRDIDLIALGTHGRGVVSQMLLGSVARHVAQGAWCDVLLAPR